MSHGLHFQIKITVSNKEGRKEYNVANLVSISLNGKIHASVKFLHVRIGSRVFLKKIFLILLTSVWQHPFSRGIKAWVKELNLEWAALCNFFLLCEPSIILSINLNLDAAGRFQNALCSSDTPIMSKCFFNTTIQVKRLRQSSAGRFLNMLLRFVLYQRGASPPLLLACFMKNSGPISFICQSITVCNE